MFEKIATRVFFTTFVAALALVGAHAVDEMMSMQPSQAATASAPANSAAEAPRAA